MIDRQRRGGLRVVRNRAERNLHAVGVFHVNVFQPVRRLGDSIRVRLPDNLPAFDFYALRLLLPEQEITGDRTTSFRVGQRPVGQISGNLVRSLCVGTSHRAILRM